MNDTVNTGVNLAVTSDGGSGIVVNKINNSASSGTLAIYPGDVVTIEITVNKTCENFGVTSSVAVPDFETVFGSREDLFTEDYYIRKTIITSVSPRAVENVDSRFDVEEYLGDEYGVTDSATVAAQKKLLFRKFFENNSLYSVMEITVTEIDSEACDIALSKQTDSTVYYPSAPLTLSSGQTAILRFEYTNDEFLPTATFAEGESGYFSPNADTTYVMKNYNCFIGRTVTLGFAVK
jgi:hypothetical protein